MESGEIQFAPEDSDLYPRHNRSLLITVTVKGPDVDLYITTFSGQ